jgi:hypothetical protein
MKKPFTAKQGQYLAFIFYYYTKIHAIAPAESDKQNYFGVSPPSIHQMGGQARSQWMDRADSPTGSLNTLADPSGATAGFGIGVARIEAQPREPG